MTKTHRKSVLKAALGLGASLAALSIAAPICAQEEKKDAKADAAPEIIVTAQFRSQKLQDTPIAITAVNAALLESRSQTNIAQVANQAPSVNIQAQGASFGPSLSVSIRGIGQGDFDPALEPGVGIYIDDVYYPQLTGALFDLLDLDRVEILRGPQGTLAGKNSEGGSIKLYSKLPDGKTGGYVQATYGSRHRLDLRASADFKISDGWYARISGVSKQQDGYVNVLDYGCTHPGGGIAATVSPQQGCLVAQEGGIGYQAIRGILRYAPDGGAVENVLSADYTHDKHTVAGETLIYANNTSPWIQNNNVPFDNRFICGPYCNYAVAGQAGGAWTGPVAAGYPLVTTSGSFQSLLDSWGVSDHLKVNLGSQLNIQSITAYREFHTHFDTKDDLSPEYVGFGQNDLRHYDVSEELRLNGKIGDTIDLAVGGYYFKQKTTYFTYQDIRYAVIPLQFIGNDPVSADSKAAFANAGWKITPALTFDGGLRYTDESKSYTFVRVNPDGVTPNPFLGSLNGVTGNYSGNQLDYRAAIDYRWSPEFLTYASVSTGFKGGGINPRPFNPAQVIPFNKEKLTNYEIGFKGDFFDRKLRLNVSAFYSKFKDIQITLLSCPQFGGPGPCAAPQNAGNATLKGVEIETTLKPTTGFTIDGSFSYLSFKYDCISTQAVPSNPNNLTGCSADPSITSQLNTSPPGTPAYKWSVGAQYELLLGNIGSITPRFDISGQSSTNGGALKPSPALAPYNGIDAYSVANGRITWKNIGKDLEASLEVTNLFNKYYFLTNFDLTGAGAGFIKAQPGKPREWAFSIKKKF